MFFFHKQPQVIYTKEPPYFRKGVLIYSFILFKVFLK